MTSIWGKTLPWGLPDADATWKFLSPGHCVHNGAKYFLKSPFKYYFAEILQYINGLMTSIWGKTLPWELPDDPTRANVDATWKILSPGHCLHNRAKSFLKLRYINLVSL